MQLHEHPLSRGIQIEKKLAIAKKRVRKVRSKPAHFLDNNSVLFFKLEPLFTDSCLPLCPCAFKLVAYKRKKTIDPYRCFINRNNTHLRGANMKKKKKKKNEENSNIPVAWRCSHETLRNRSKLRFITTDVQRIMILR